MKEYRLGYDYLLLSDRPIEYKGDFVTGIALNVIIKVRDKKGKEVIFESNELMDKCLFTEKGDGFYLSDLITCGFDRGKFYNFEVNVPLFRKSGLSSIQWEVDSYSKDIETKNEIFNLPVYEVVKILEKEFIDIMKNNIDLFDNSDNHSAQTTSYFTQEVNHL